MKELLELEAKNAKSIEEEIEEERQKVDAKTPITETVCTLCPCIICTHQNLQLESVAETLPAALISCCCLGFKSSVVGQEYLQDLQDALLPSVPSYWTEDAWLRSQSLTLMHDAAHVQHTILSAYYNRSLHLHALLVG